MRTKEMIEAEIKELEFKIFCEHMADFLNGPLVDELETRVKELKAELETVN